MYSNDKADVTIVGASVAGLLCAAAAADTGARVVVFDRRDRPTPDASIAPHGRLPHVLLGGGVVALESLLPGLVGRLLDDGAQPARSNSGVWWAGGIRPTWESPHAVPLARRAVIEEAIRRRVEALPRVSIRYGVRVTGLTVDGDRIRGIETDDASLSSDLVVEAAGRGSHLDRWLDAAGQVAPEIEQQQIDVSYSALFVRDPVGCLGSTNWVVIQNQPPEWTRIGLAIRVDATTWGVVLAGYHGDVPPTDLHELRAFAGTLPIDHVATVLDRADGDTEILNHRIPTNRRRRLGRRLPSGLVVVGDSWCSFNPVFGQGMTVAAQQAVALRQHLTTRDATAARTGALQRRINHPATEAWIAATSLDAGHPETSGPRPNPIRRRYLRALIDAATRDATVARRLDQVAALTVPGTSLLRPDTAVRVLARRRATADAAGDQTPITSQPIPPRKEPVRP